MNNKLDILKLYSNPKLVYKKALELYGPEVEIKPSTRKTKKYMIKDMISGKWVHFGLMGMEDYTKHKDEERRERFLNRNRKWNTNYIFSPSFLAYNLLW